MSQILKTASYKRSGKECVEEEWGAGIFFGVKQWEAGGFVAAMSAQADL